MKRPMLIITISYIIGILLGLYLKLNIALFILVIFGTLYIFLCNKILTLKNINFKLIVISACIIILSSLRVQWSEARFNNLYKENMNEVYFIGKIVSIEKESQYYNNFIVKITNVDGNSMYKNSNILLKVKKKDKLSNQIEYGDTIAGTTVLEKPSVQRNYKGYNYSEYLRTKNVYMIAKSSASDIYVVKKKSLFVVNVWINMLRNKLKANLEEVLPKESLDIANAYLLGYSSEIDRSDRNIFNDACLSHVLAISGMHVGFIIMTMKFLLKKFEKRKGKYFFILFLIFFSQLTGGSASVVRAVLMCSIGVSSKLVYRKSDTLNNIAISAFVILIFNPYEILNLGFQLSFLGTLGIVLFHSKLNYIWKKLDERLIMRFNTNKTEIPILIKKTLKGIKSIILVSISANILIFPVIVYKFNNLSLIFIISNIIATPLLIMMSLWGYII